MKKTICLLISVCFLLNSLIFPISAESKNDTSNAIQSISINDENKAYTSVIYTSDVLISSSSNDIVYYVDISSKATYTKIEVSYASTVDINLSNYQKQSFAYADMISIPITFSAVVNASRGIMSDYHSTPFDKIILNYNVLNGKEVVESKSIELSVLITPSEVYVGSIGNAAVYDAYIHQLRDNEHIDEYQFCSAQRTMVTLSYSVEAKDYDAEYIKAEIEKENSTLYKYYNDTTRNIDSKTMSEFNSSIFKAQEKNSRASLAGVEPIVRITIKITSLNSNATSLKVSGTITWTDYEGVSHPLRQAQVAIMDQDWPANQTLATVYTDNYGNYSATVTNYVDIFEGGCDIYAEASTETSQFKVASDSANATFSKGYYFCTPPIMNVKGSQNEIITEDVSQTVSFKAFYIHQALIAGYYYYSTMNSGDIQKSTVYYPGSGDNSFCHPLTKIISIYSEHYKSWDTVLHELGHLAQYYIGANGSFSQEHCLDENLAERYGKELGIQGAWNEGWSTYFSIASQNYYDKNVITVSNIPDVANDAYDSENAGSYDLYYSIGLGEANELTVASLLFHLIYKDKPDYYVGLSDQTVWNITKASGATCFSEFMEELYSQVPSSLISNIGHWLQYNHICDSPYTAYNSTQKYYYSVPGTFGWTTAQNADRYSDNNNYSYSNRFRFTFWDENFNIVYQLPVMASTSTNSSTTVTLTSSQWSSLTNVLGSGVFYWGIATYQNNSPATGPYYSELVMATLE